LAPINTILLMIHYLPLGIILSILYIKLGIMEFKEFNLHPDLQRGLAEAEYVTCMPVQEQVLTHAFGGQDLYVQSQTGTGKTAAFLVVIYQRLLTESLLAGKKALIMAPTRELAVQIEEEAKLLGKYLPYKVGSFYGGVGYAQQEKMLRENVHIMTGTPGRVLDLNKSGRMNLMDIAFLVLDEADRMFDMGFYPDLRKLIKVVPPADRRQTMLFSATLNAWVKNLAWDYTVSPFEIEITPTVVTVEEVDQILYHVPSEEKMKLLLGILDRERPETAIIFCNTKRYTEIIAKRLRLNGYECEFIIGDMPQPRRLQVINNTKAGKTKFLVATDVAARGLDIEGLAMVINYDLPVEAENYVHRIGRTARAGKTGKAITLASEQDVYELPAIERYIGKKIPSEIAVAELHAEDKSAGQRIQTEFYEDRREERHPGRPPGRPPKSRSGPRVPETGKAHPHTQGRSVPRGHGHDDKKGGNIRQGHRGLSGSPRGENRRQQNPPQETAFQKTALQKTDDLSRMSFDERMALYKKKYDSGSRTPNRQDRPSGGKAAGRAVGKAAGKAAEKPAAETHNAPPPPEQSAPAKKGILSRLLGKFKK